MDDYKQDVHDTANDENYNKIKYKDSMPASISANIRRDINISKRYSVNRNNNSVQDPIHQ